MTKTITIADEALAFLGEYKLFTMHGLANDGADHEELGEFFADWGTDGKAEDMIDRLDGSTWSDGRTVDIGSSTTSPEYRRIRSIAGAVLRELRG